MLIQSKFQLIQAFSLGSITLFNKQIPMLQAANTELFNPLVPKAHSIMRQNLPFPLQIKPVKVR